MVWIHFIVVFFGLNVILLEFAINSLYLIHEHQEFEKEIEEAINRTMEMTMAKMRTKLSAISEDRMSAIEDQWSEERDEITQIVQRQRTKRLNFKDEVGRKVSKPILK